MAQVSNKELRRQQAQELQRARQAVQLDKYAQAQKLDRTLLLVVAGLCLVGIGIAGYLTYVHYTDSTIVCAFGGGCETVNKSKYAAFLGVPVAVLGLITYVILLGLSITRLRLAQSGQQNGRYVLDFGIFLLNLAAVGFSAYLTSMEAFVINNWCMWCVGSATTLTIMLLVNGYRLWLDYFSSAAEL